MSDATISISPLELLALKKLVLINDALGRTIKGRAEQEQRALTSILNEIVLRADLANKTAKADPA